MYDFQQLNIFLNQFDSSKHDMLLDAYSRSLYDHHVKCEEAFKKQDLKSLYASAHDIKSLALTIGHKDLGEQARLIEKNAKEEQEKIVYAEVPTLLVKIENLLDVIKSHMNERARA